MNRSQEKFANEMIKHGNAVKAYRKAYPSCKSDQTARTNANRLLKNASIQQKIKEGSKKVSELAETEAIEESKNSAKAILITAMRKREILAEIIEGKAKIQEYYIKKGKPVPYYREPTALERLKAIDIENKMTGDNAAIKSDHTVSLGFFDFLKKANTVD